MKYSFKILQDIFNIKKIIRKTFLHVLIKKQ